MKYYLALFALLLGFTACRVDAPAPQMGGQSLEPATTQTVAQSTANDGAETPYCIPVGACKGDFSCCPGETWVFNAHICGGNHKWCCWTSGHACSTPTCCSHCCNGGCVNFDRNC